MSAKELKAEAERTARMMAKAFQAPVAKIGKGRLAAATPETARGLSIKTRALAKVLPQEARVVATELRSDAKHLMAMQERRKRQAPAARVVAPPAPLAPTVAKAAAASPLPAGSLGTGPEPPSDLEFDRPKKAKKVAAPATPLTDDRKEELRQRWLIKKAPANKYTPDRYQVLPKPINQSLGEWTDLTSAEKAFVLAEEKRAIENKHAFETVISIARAGHQTGQGKKRDSLLICYELTGAQQRATDVFDGKELIFRMPASNSIHHIFIYRGRMLLEYDSTGIAESELKGLGKYTAQVLSDHLKDTVVADMSEYQREDVPKLCKEIQKP